jgi:putative transcriptional regulator
VGLALNRLREFRESLGMTQERLAATVQVSRQTIISIEASRYVPSLELALRLGRVFGRPVEEIFNDAEGGDAR